jgi:RNA polymerase sigma-70 factor (ECF subfamily)
VEQTREQRYDDLLAEVHVPLHRYLLRRCTEPDDLLSDVLLVLWRRLDDVPPDARLPWAYGVAHGCLQNDDRSRARRLRLVRRVALEPVAPPPEDDPDLADALGGLRPDDQELLRLWAWEQLAPREIAVVLDVTPNAASIRLHRALGRLREALLGKDGTTAGHMRVEREGRR